MDYSQTRKIIEQISNSDFSDIDWLFCYCLGVKRSELVKVCNVTPSQYKNLVKYAKRLKKGMPLSVALGFTEFCGNKILVSRHVLTPRCETEELTDYVIKDILKNCKPVRVLDLCCGSGAIGVSIKKACGEFADVTLSDISNHAIKTTQKNAKLNGVQISAIKSDMLKNVWGHYDYIVCNPPYIEFGDPNVEARVNKFEPHLALYAKDKGYWFYTYLSEQAKHYQLKGGKLCLEVGYNMAQTVANMFEGTYKAQIVKDMQGIDRFVILTKI